MGNINIKSSTVEKGLDLAKDFIQSVIKPSMDEVGELFADKVKLWRVKNQIRNIEKVKAIVEKEGITTKAINIKVLFPYLDAVALEDDETLQDMWANLFVNYIDSEKNLTTHVYPEILRQLSSNEIETINILFSTGRSTNYIPKDEITIPMQSLHNLLRLGLVESTGIYLGNSREVSQYNLTRRDLDKKNIKFNYRLSRFGVDFYLACTREPK